MAGMALAAEIEAASECARRAGSELLARFSLHGIPAELKAGDHREPVTEADLHADRIIRELLAERFPGDALLTEESVPYPGSNARRWVVDPLDGTANYTAGLPFWAVSIALEVDGACALGCVYDPVRDELFTSVAGEGAHCNGRSVRVRQSTSLEDAVAAILLNPHDAARPEVTELKANLRAVRELGATALELAWVAAGRLDLCLFRRNERIWDWLAGVRLIEDAGGEVRAWSEIPAGTIAASTRLHEATRALL